MLLYVNRKSEMVYKSSPTLLLIKYVINSKLGPGHRHDRDADVADGSPKGHLGERTQLTLGLGRSHGNALRTGPAYGVRTTLPMPPILDSQSRG